MFENVYKFFVFQYLLESLIFWHPKIESILIWKKTFTHIKISLQIQRPFIFVRVYHSYTKYIEKMVKVRAFNLAQKYREKKNISKFLHE